MGPSDRPVDFFSNQSLGLDVASPENVAFGGFSAFAFFDSIHLPPDSAVPFDSMPFAPPSS